MQNETVGIAREQLRKKAATLLVKRLFDILVSVVLLAVLSPMLLIFALMIVIDSPGGVFYLQERVGKDGDMFRIIKFRSMIAEADRIGAQVTGVGDSRITRVGRLMRKVRIDELPQLVNVLIGDMSLVGPRPEVPRYVEHYSDEDLATLLVRPGITARSSVYFSNESELLDGREDSEKIYIERILPAKMKINREYIVKISVGEDLRVILLTVKNLFKSCDKTFELVGGLEDEN